MATINRKTVLTKNKLEKAFKMVDKDGSGQITIDELKQIFINSNLDEKIWSDLIK